MRFHSYRADNDKRLRVTFGTRSNFYIANCFGPFANQWALIRKTSSQKKVAEILGWGSRLILMLTATIRPNCTIFIQTPRPRRVVDDVHVPTFNK